MNILKKENLIRELYLDYLYWNDIPNAVKYWMNEEDKFDSEKDFFIAIKKAILYHASLKPERRVCVACQSGKTKVLKDGWLICLNCGVKWLKRPTVHKHYSQSRIDNWKIPGRFDDRLFLIRMALSLKKPPKYKDIMNQVGEHLQKTDVVLEVGFGAGLILDYLRSLSKWKRIVGIDICGDYVRFTRNKGHEVYCMDVCERKLLGLINKCDLVICREVMEHVVSPIMFLKSCNEYVHGKGVLWVNFAFSDKEVLPQGEWHYWTMDGIKILLKKCGLKPVDVKRFPHSYRIVCKKLVG